MKRAEALLVTPLPPLQTGLATYALRILEGTADIIGWRVACTPGSDPSCLPQGVDWEPVSGLSSVPPVRIFQLGNSPDCFPVLQALYRFGGTGLFHELHLHHMIRHCCLEQGLPDQYARELRFEYGPSAGKVAKILSKPPSSEAEYDARLKRFPLSGRAVNACGSAVCLNGTAAAWLGRCLDRVFVVGHPLTPLGDTGSFPALPGGPVIGMAGGFNHGRNLSAALEAVAVLRRRHPDTVMLLAGGGYPEGLPEWVTVTGRLPEDEYQAAIRAMDAALDLRHPPLGETSGSLLEVMRAGVPPVVSASGSFREIPSGAVLRVPVEDLAAGAAAALELVLEDRDLREGMSRAARAWAMEQGSIERMRREWAFITEALLSVPSSGDAWVEPDFWSGSLSAAWHDPPEGFERDTSGDSVTWTFRSGARLEGPTSAGGALVTARGDGTVSGVPLGDDFGVVSTTGRELDFEGSGELTSVFWKRA